MSFFNKYTPYVEAPTVRITTQPVSGGIIIDRRTAQGISFRRNKNLRQTTLLPQINSGRTDFVIESLNFGIRPSVDPTIPYVDKEKLTALAYIQDPNQFGFPLQVGDFLPNDGAIEALAIRDVAQRDSIEVPVAHKIRGTIMCGNEDNFEGADTKGSYFLYEPNSDFVPFEDSVETVADGTIVIVGFVSDALNDKVLPFDDSELDTRHLSTTNNDINAQLLLMTGSADDDFRPLNTKASTSGFVYPSKEGTDSVAFGGLLNL